MKNEHDQSQYEMLCAYILGECSAEERVEIERELERSPEMRAQRATIEQTIGMVKDALATSESLSPAAATAVLSAASFARPSAWQSVPWMRIAAGIGAIALGVTLFRASETRTTVERQRAETELARADERGRKLDDGSKLAFEGGLNERAAGAPSVAQNQREKKTAQSKAETSGEMTHESISVAETQPSKQSDVKEKLATSFGVGATGRDGDVDAGRPNVGYTLSIDPSNASKPADLVAGSAPVGVPNATDGASADSKDARAAFPEGAASSPDPTSTSSTRARELRKDEVGVAMSANGTSGSGNGGAGPSTSGPGTPGSYPAPIGHVAGGKKGRPSRAAPTSPAKPQFNARAPLDRLSGLGYSGGAGTAPPAEKTPDGEDLKKRRGVGESVGRLDSVEARDDEARLNYWQLPPEAQQQYLDGECRRILERCVRRPNERPRDMYFRFWGDNPFEVAALDPLSTFSADVDTASYALARRFLNEGNLPEKAQIRTEEFVNYFKSDVAAPTQSVFAIHTDLTPSRFSQDSTRAMMRVVVRGKDLSKIERKPLNLTFVVDVSGSMREQNRLEMVKHSIRLLASQLDQYDKIGIVKFSTDASLVLLPTSVAKRAEIESAIQPLAPEGSTNSSAGLELGYAVALGALDPNAINRVVFLSDGVANVGETDPAKISEHVKPMREKGIYLNTIGVGMNNHNDVLLEQLANKADGVCNYIDTPEEAKRALVDNFTGAFQPIARDVKIQVEFDPAQVLRYRLLGYENRAIADADFRNDKIDAGELGAGHQVTALYEIERQGPASSEKPLAVVRLRWKDPKNFGANAEQDAATEIGEPVRASQMTTFEGAGQSYRRAAIVAQFAEILRRSVHARGDSIDDLLNESLKLAKETPNDKDFIEFVLLVSKSKDLILRTMPACDELCQAVDSVRESQYRMAQLEQLRKEQDQKLVDDLRHHNDELEARLRDLVRRRLESDGR